MQAAVVLVCWCALGSFRLPHTNNCRPPLSAHTPTLAFLPSQAVYTALKETEQRATDLLPLWRVSERVSEQATQQQTLTCRVGVISHCHAVCHAVLRCAVTM